MVITIDIGDPYQLHPPDKADVGHRLALQARHVAYGEDIVYSGPLYDKMAVEGNKIRLTFKNRGSGLILGTSPYVPAGATPPSAPTKLTGFAIAAADQKFVWADAVIDGDTVVVSSDQLAAPVAVRYDWAESPTGDLYNKEGLPASPFRTDTWDK
jgi:sialate O-acetylesterase